LQCKPINENELEFLSSLISYQFGIDVSKPLEELASDIVVCYGSTGRIRRVLLGNKLMASLRASDYHIIPYEPLARILHRYTAFPRNRLVLVNEMVLDIVGRNTIFARHVVACDYACLPGDEVLVVDELDRLLGVASLRIDCETIITAIRGPAAIARFWCDIGG